MKTLEKEARRLCRHTIVYTDMVDIEAAAMAMQGLKTKTIAHVLGITESQAQYRISKAQKSLNTRFRADYRNIASPLAEQMLKATRGMAIREVERKVAPRFIPLARSGVGRITPK